MRIFSRSSAILQRPVSFALIRSQNFQEKTNESRQDIICWCQTCEINMTFSCIVPMYLLCHIHNYACLCFAGGLKRSYLCYNIHDKIIQLRYLEHLLYLHI